MNSKRRFSLAGMVIGALLALSPIYGLIGTVFGMQRAINALGSSGTSDPAALSGSINSVLLSTVTGFLLCPVGILTLGISLYFHFRRRDNMPPAEPTQHSL